MAEVSRVLREVQLDTEGRLVPVRGSKFVEDDSAVVGATKAFRKMAVARNQDVGSFVGVTKAGLLNKKAAGTGMVKAASWSDFGTCGTKPAAGSKTTSGREPGPKEERKAEPAAVALITKETVPQSFIDRIRAHPSRKLPPLSQDLTDLYNEFLPEAVALEEENAIRWNYFVDLEQDCLRQYNEKGYAEVGVDFTKGMKQIFILPQE